MSINKSNYLQDRAKYQVRANFSDNTNSDNLILTSPSDLGVCRNGGRRGASLGPAAIVSVLGSMTRLSDNSTLIKQVTNNILEPEFSTFQNDSARRIKKAISGSSSAKNIVHIGGGHDHIYPFVKAILSFEQNVHIVNIDSHLDTRDDIEAHSGTPFRQLINEFQDRISLTQIGINKFSNVKSNYEGLSVKQNIVAPEVFLQRREQYVNKDDVIVLSLDADVITSEAMEAVSAVNFHGISVEMVRAIIDSIYFDSSVSRRYFGVYEYNPVYDNLSQKGARLLSSLIYKFI